MKILIQNKKAYHSYAILEKIEAGVSLLGNEVKSIKSGRINLSGAYVVLKNGEMYLLNAGVPPYQPQNTPSEYDSLRPRKLLLKKSEIKYLAGRSQQKGLTLVPLKVYTKKGKIKIEIGIARGKKKIDKRETIKKREAEREIGRAMREKA